MIAKTRIIEHLGEDALLLPRRIREALLANDRAKVRMTALQAALAHALEPTAPPTDLAAEARAAGLDTQALHRLVAGAGDTGDGFFRAPGLAELLAELGADVEAMIAAVAAGEADPEGRIALRWRAAAAALAMPEGVLARDAVRAITAPGSDGDDSVHRLVMDLHKRLNRLAAAHAEELVAGAHCSGLGNDDRRAVSAFMAGLARTRPLKFDHPGLDTTATRAGDRLILQNDIGTTDAHVLCISVDNEAVILTYTDVHRPRARFLVSLFDGFDGVTWTMPVARRVEGLAEGDAFHLVTGRLAFDDRSRRDAFLEEVGAALVFLIDWNKARKQLQRFVSKTDAIAILRWSSRHAHGHRAFLELGGAGLVDGAIQRTAAGHIGYGVRLEQAMGRDQAVDFLQQVLRIASENLLSGRADRLVRDAVDAELAGRLERSGSTLLQGVVVQAGLARSIVSDLDEAIRERAAGRSGDGAAVAAIAKRIEEKADRLALELRSTAERYGVRDDVVPLIDTMEQAIDELEEAAFFFSVLPTAGTDDGVDAHLARLSAAAIRSAEAVARMADAASCVPDGHRVDVDDALAALADLFALEHEADGLERAAIAAVLSADADAERIFAAVECARRIETATDRFARAGHLLRGHVIGDLNVRGRDATRR